MENKNIVGKEIPVSKYMKSTEYHFDNTENELAFISLLVDISFIDEKIDKYDDRDFSDLSLDLYFRYLEKININEENMFEKTEEAFNNLAKIGYTGEKFKKEVEFLLDEKTFYSLIKNSLKTKKEKMYLNDLIEIAKKLKQIEEEVNVYASSDAKTEEKSYYLNKKTTDLKNQLAELVNNNPKIDYQTLGKIDKMNEMIERITVNLGIPTESVSKNSK